MAESIISDKYTTKKVKVLSISSVPANSYLTVTILFTGNNAIPNGYKIIGILGYDAGNTYLICENLTFDSSFSSITARVHNIDSSTRSTELEVMLSLGK